MVSKVYVVGANIHRVGDKPALSFDRPNQTDFAGGVSFDLRLREIFSNNQLHPRELLAWWKRDPLNP
jgi:hypothetical protein